MDPPTNSKEDSPGIQLGPIDPESEVQPDIQDDDYDDEYGSLVRPPSRPRPPPPRNLPPPTRRRPPLFWTPRLPGRRGRAPSPPPSSSSSPSSPSTSTSPAAAQSSPLRSGGQPPLLPLASYLDEWLRSNISTLRDAIASPSSSASFSRYKASLALLLLCTLGYVALDSYDILHVSFNDDREVPKWKKLNASLQRAKRRLDVLLESEYGELSETLFGNETISKAFHSDSVHRLKNRMKMKIIQAGLMRKIVAKGEPGSGFVWVTGGDDYAAGYGNFYNQTYTWVIEDTAKDAFNMVGIKFHAKNYAMGGTPSGPEISLCMQTFFGNDIDILSWDYAKSDEDNYDLYRLWGNRAGIHPTTPTLFRLGKDPTRSSIDDDFQRFGLSTVQLDVDYIRSLVPDTSWETVDDLPPQLRYYKCAAGQVEGGSALCRDNKWDTEGTTCDLSEYQSKEEHRGWKDHKLIGRVIGVFLVETLLSALAELEESLLEVSTIRNISVSQDKDRYAFQSSSLKEMHEGANLGKNTKFLGGHAKYSPFWRSSSFCHSALLPNHARFTGAVTMSMRSYRHDHGYFVGYDEGYAVDALPETKPNDGQFLLAYLPETRQNCSDVYRADFKDFFLVRKRDGWVKVALPNQLEMKQFRIMGDKRGAHVIALCAEGVSVPAIKLKKIEMKVDGADVLDVRTLDDELSNCRLLVGEHESFLWIAKPGGTGQFELEVKLNEPEELRISTIIII